MLKKLFGKKTVVELSTHERVSMAKDQVMGAFQMFEDAHAKIVEINDELEKIKNEDLAKIEKIKEEYEAKIKHLEHNVARATVELQMNHSLKAKVAEFVPSLSVSK